MAHMTIEARVRSLEKRLIVLETVLIEFFRNNGHSFVGGNPWSDDDIQAIQASRHD